MPATFKLFFVYKVELYTLYTNRLVHEYYHKITGFQHQ